MNANHNLAYERQSMVIMKKNNVIM